MENETVETLGLPDKIDAKKKELVTLVEVRDALNGIFEPLPLLTPRTLADSRFLDFPHVVAQAVVLLHWDSTASDIVRALPGLSEYGRHENDNLWVTVDDPSTLEEGTVVILMNRRVGGWDGSVARPVRELLGGGGHVKTVWSSRSERFLMKSVEETICEELGEELGLVTSSDPEMVGGFINSVTNELVILGVVWIAPAGLPEIQQAALGNLSENTDGIYLGPLEPVMESYLRRADFFAGGEAAKSTNFPSNRGIRKRLGQLTEKAV